MIRNLHQNDAPAVLEIYRQGLETGEASFETEPPDWPGWQAKYHQFCRLVWEQDGEVLGWAALALLRSAFTSRHVTWVMVSVAG
jgi:phosphinothricin acetyltransferase